ncbi:hypothetical protein, partial [Vreelandella aquamarina]|uniref:hypothetical protein n=1 Tax=Vreelandella aquamarina TaxID=77097 RepID=UPI002359F529
GAECVNRARSDLWGAGTSNRPVYPTDNSHPVPYKYSLHTGCLPKTYNHLPAFYNTSCEIFLRLGNERPSDIWV